MALKKFVVILIFLVVVGIVGFSILGNEGIENISTEELAQKINQEGSSKDVIFLDVREIDEYESGHIKGMDNLPLSILDGSKLTFSKNAEIVLICRSGNRSMQAAEVFEKAGYHHVVNVEGGIQSWHGELIN